MKILKTLTHRQHLKVHAGWMLITFLISAGLYAQDEAAVTGKVLEEKSRMPIPFATIALIKPSEKQPITGTISDKNGLFTISGIPKGKYKLRISSVGYKTATIYINISSFTTTNAGTIYLSDSTLLIAEIVVKGERVKSKSEGNKTIYYMNKKILAASGNTPDVLRHITGIQVDLKQNISLEGRQNILLYVDGKERDKSYISQLNPARIDRHHRQTTMQMYRES